MRPALVRPAASLPQLLEANGRKFLILGLEFGYTDFGKIKASGGEVKAYAVPISLTAGVPIGNRFSVFAKGGGLYGHTDVSASVGNLVER